VRIEQGSGPLTHIVSGAGPPDLTAQPITGGMLENSKKKASVGKRFNHTGANCGQ